MTEKLCFVIGPIGKDGSVERKHADLLLHVVIKYVLETEEFGYKVKRADQDADPGMINDRVVSDIIHAHLVIADLTDLNPNAFYELGIRHSTERPAIHIAKFGTQLPFDTLSHRSIFVDLTEWQSIEQARSRLRSLAHAIEDPAFRVSNPITQANASFKMRESADPQDQIIARLQERVADLERRPTLPFATNTIPAGLGANILANALAKAAGNATLSVITARTANVRNLNGKRAVRRGVEGLGGVIVEVDGGQIRLSLDEWNNLPVWDGP
jgi:hypothetical protein